MTHYTMEFIASNQNPLPNYYDFVGCWDSSSENLEIARERFSATCFENAEELMKKTDAVVLAVP